MLKNQILVIDDSKFFQNSTCDDLICEKDLYNDFGKEIKNAKI